jgi:hypothetical protein
VSKKETCSNCDDKQVSVSIPCPECCGDGHNEIDYLRKLANWVEENFKGRSRPPERGLDLLTGVRIAQGKHYTPNSYTGMMARNRKIKR